MILDESLCTFNSKTGVLGVDIRQIFGSHGRIRIHAWEEEILIEQMDSNVWVKDDTIIDFKISSAEVNLLSPSHPVRKFALSLPVWALEVVQPFQINQLRLLRILSIEPLATNLAKEFPVVFWMLPDTLGPNFNALAVADLLKLKPSNVIKHCFGYYSKSLVNFLKIIFGFSYDYSDLNALRHLFSTRDWEQLANLPIINWQSLKPFVKEKKYFGNQYMRNFLASSTLDDYSRSIETCMQLDSFLGKIYYENNRIMNRTKSAMHANALKIIKD